MLVLNRKIGETVIIDKDISIQVLSVQGTKVSLGFEAPQEVAIVRKEVVERNLAKKRKANNRA